MFSLKLTQSLPEIERSINEALAKELNKAILRKKSVTLGALKRATRSWISSTDEVASLLNGRSNELRTQFGLTQPEEAVEAIISSIVDSVQVTFKPFSKNLRGGISFNFQPEDNANLLALARGHQMTKKGEDLHWLDWLLTKGDSIIVIGYSYTPDRKGRAGVGAMKKGGSFRVDPRHSGIRGNNFVSRAFIGREKEVVRIIQESLL